MNFLVKSVTVTVGGHSERKWYCSECGKCFGEERPAKCGAERKEKELSHEKFRELVGRPDLAEEAIELWLAAGDYSGEDIYQEKDRGPCPSTAFEFRSAPGMEIDRVDGGLMALYAMLGAR